MSAQPVCLHLLGWSVLVLRNPGVQSCEDVRALRGPLGQVTQGLTGGTYGWALAGCWCFCLRGAV